MQNLLYFVARADIQAVDFILSRYFFQKYQLFQALEHACQHDLETMVDYFLELGVRQQDLPTTALHNVNYVSKPLAYAIQNASVRIIKKLLDSGAVMCSARYVEELNHVLQLTAAGNICDMLDLFLQLTDAEIQPWHVQSVIRLHNAVAMRYLMLKAPPGIIAASFHKVISKGSVDILLCYIAAGFDAVSASNLKLAFQKLNWPVVDYLISRVKDSDIVDGLLRDMQTTNANVAYLKRWHSEGIDIGLVADLQLGLMFYGSVADLEYFHQQELVSMMVEYTYQEWKYFPLATIDFIWNHHCCRETLTANLSKVLHDAIKATNWRLAAKLHSLGIGLPDVNYQYTFWMADITCLDLAFGIFGREYLLQARNAFYIRISPDIELQFQIRLALRDTTPLQRLAAKAYVQHYRALPEPHRVPSQVYLWLVTHPDRFSDVASI